MPFFSVVIPLYNKEKFVADAVNSILAQTFQDFEIVIVEDCSTDDSLNIANGFLSEKTRIIRHDVNKGLSASRNTGIKNASAEYIAFLDADDLWKPDYLEKIYELIARFPQAGLYATHYEQLYPNGVTVSIATNLKDFHADNIVADFFESSLAQPIYCSCSVVVRKSVFEQIGYFDEKITFGEDIDFNIRSNKAFPLAYSPESLVIYRIFSEHQITVSGLRNKIITDFDSYEPTENNSLKKYLDVNRYFMARQYKMLGDWENLEKMKSKIDSENLNKKQLFLLNLPSFIDKMASRFKTFMVQKGIRFTSFS